MTPTVDLAFTLAETLPPDLLAAADSLADGESGEARWSALFHLWLADLAAELPAPLRRPAYSLGLELCDDGDIAALNASWRHRNGPTDVLAFAALEEAPPLPATRAGGAPLNEPLELGDIVISLETAERQAVEAGHSLQRELLFLASHGLLHLLGWDHPDDASLEAMLQRQEQLIGSAAEDLADS